MVLSFHQLTLCVHFCQLRKLHLDPELYLNGTQILIIGEAKFIALLLDSKLSFIPHITSLKGRCTKSLDLINVVSNTTWETDRHVLLCLYRALIRSKSDYGCIVWFCKTVVYKVIGHCSQSRFTIMFRISSHITSTEFICEGE